MSFPLHTILDSDTTGIQLLYISSASCDKLVAVSTSGKWLPTSFVLHFQSYRTMCTLPSLCPWTVGISLTSCTQVEMQLLISQDRWKRIAYLHSSMCIMMWCWNMIMRDNQKQAKLITCTIILCAMCEEKLQWTLSFAENCQRFHNNVT